MEVTMFAPWGPLWSLPGHPVMDCWRPAFLTGLRENRSNPPVYFWLLSLDLIWNKGIQETFIEDRVSGVGPADRLELRMGEGCGVVDTAEVWKVASED